MKVRGGDIKYSVQLFLEHIKPYSYFSTEELIKFQLGEFIDWFPWIVKTGMHIEYNEK